MKRNIQPLEKEEDPPLATASCSLEANLETSRELTKAIRDKVVLTFPGVADVGLMYRVVQLEISDVWLGGVTACRTDAGN